MKIARRALFTLALGLIAVRGGAELAPCNRSGLPEGSRCGSIPVPARHGDPGAGTLALQAVVLPATGERRPDPIVFLAGGPGVAATEGAGFFARNLTLLRRSRDLVLVDLRGTGPAGGACRLSAAEKRMLIQAFVPPASFEHCLPDADARGSLRTAVFAQDLEAVRQALGAPQINLLAASYGTRLALAYARQFPQRVRTSVLRGVASPADVIPFHMLAGARDELAKLEAEHPGLSQKHAGLVKALTATPIRVQLDAAREVVVDGATLEGLVRFLLYDPATARALPGLLEAASGGVPQALRQAVAGIEAVVERFSIPVLLGVLCSEDVPFWEPSQDGEPLATAAMRDNARATCKSWSVPPAPPEFRTDVTAPVPTLLLSGAHDPATPPHLAQRIAGALPRSLHVVTPRLGHLPTWTSCHAKIAAAFIDAGSLEGLDVGCAGVPPGR